MRLLYPDAVDIAAAVLGRTGSKTEQPQAVVTLHVSAVHGSLEFASYPVAVGNYKGYTVVGAARFLDRKLKGRLSQRFAMKLYPYVAGTAEVVLVPDGKPPGALIVGLGEVGSITPDMVTDGIMQAALRLAMIRLEQPRKPEEEQGPRSAAFSTLLIGSNSGRALTVETSVMAVIKGALLANRALREQGLIEKVRVDAVEFIEQYEDLATLAAHAVRHWSHHLRLILDHSEEIKAEHYLKVGEGGLLGRPLFAYDEGWWRRVQVSQTEDAAGGSGLKFVMLTDRARAEVTLQATQRKLVDRLVESAIGQESPQSDLSATLYELLLPNQLKEESQETANLLLILDSHAAQYPWEMLAERTSEKEVLPRATRIGVLRQLSIKDYRVQVRPPQGNNALVIGEPALGSDAKDFAPLPGARAEAEAVAKVIEEFGYTTGGASINAQPLEIVNRLYAKEYRILHIAGHGQYRPDCPSHSGVVIGDGMFLTAAEIEQLRVVPELVFLNCCFLGKWTQQPRRTRPLPRAPGTNWRPASPNS